jgi:hypothetical protein
MGEEKKREARLQAERDRMALELAQKEQELVLWERGQEAKMRLKMQAQNAAPKMRRDAHPESINAVEKKCPKCSAELDHPRWLAARRWGYCNNCKES